MRPLFRCVLAFVSVIVCTPLSGAAQTIPDDMAVTFTLCTEGSPTDGAVCVTGSNDPLTNWETGVELEKVDDQLWRVTIVFPKGTDAQVRYKYRKNGCKDWESDPDRSVTLPTDGTTKFELPPDSFDRVSPIGCGLSSQLESEVIVCFQLCMAGEESAGGMCVIGNIRELGAWDVGVPLDKVGDDLLQACIVFPKGTVVPLDVQYKFQKDECRTWETLQEDPFLNRQARIDRESPPVRTLTSTWNDGRGTCDNVPLTDESWGTLKSRYDR